MLIPISEEVLQAQARDRVFDTLLGSLGVSAAVVSASFAAYMVVVGPAVRSMPNRQPPLSMAGPPNHAPRTIATLPAGARDAAALEPGDIDFDPTGSIPPTLPQAVRERSPERAAAKTVLPDFAVRDAFDGTALVEAHGALHVVQPGAVIEGAGTVLSIARHGSGWMVATTGGTILQRR